MQSQVVLHVNAVCFCTVPYNVSVTFVTGIVRTAGAGERTIHQLRDLVDGIAANVNDHIYTFRYKKLIGTGRQVEDKSIFIFIKSIRSLCFHFEPVSTALSVQDRVGGRLCTAVSIIRFGNHVIHNAGEVNGNTFYQMIFLIDEGIVLTVDVRSRGNFQVTTKTIKVTKVQFSAYNQLR